MQTVCSRQAPPEWFPIPSSRRDPVIGGPEVLGSNRCVTLKSTAASHLQTSLHTADTNEPTKLLHQAETQSDAQ